MEHINSPQDPSPESHTGDERRGRRRRPVAIAGVALALSALGVGVAAYATASSPEDGAGPPAAVASDSSSDTGPIPVAARRRMTGDVQPPSAFTVVDVEDDSVELTADCGLTPEDIAALNAEEDALAAFLDERGIAYERETDAEGIRMVVWDENDEAANDAVDAFYAERYPMAPEEIAELNAEEDALAAFLDERGIAYERETDASGVHWVVWDENDEAANEAVSEFFSERYPLTPEEVAEHNAEEDALAAFLDERGIAYERETDADGVRWVVWDENDEAANDAVSEYYASQMEDCEDI